MAGFATEENLQLDLCVVCGDRASGKDERIFNTSLVFIFYLHQVVTTELLVVRAAKDSSSALFVLRLDTSAGVTWTVR